MRRSAAILLLAGALMGPLSLWAACPIPNINNPFAVTCQGPGPDGGYPMPVTTNTGCPLDVTSSGGLSACVTQCTSPWVVSGAVAATQGGAWNVGVNNFPATQSVSQGTSPWLSGTQGLDPVSGLWKNAGASFLNANSTSNQWGLVTYSQTCGNSPLTGTQNPIGSYPYGQEMAGFLFGGTAISLQTVSLPVYRVSISSGIVSYREARTPDRFFTISTAAAGNTAIWTPSPGTRFRLMRYMVTVTDQATQAAPGTLTISLFDGAAGATGQVHDIFVPALGLVNTGSLYNSGWITLDNGYISTAANNVLNINLSAALTAGTVRVICAGTEE